MSKRRRTLPRARARKSARRTTTILHVQSCTVRARARRARSIISDQRPDAHGARTRRLGRNRKPNRSGGRRGNARASTPILAFSFTQLLAHVTSFKLPISYTAGPGRRSRHASVRRCDPGGWPLRAAGGPQPLSALWAYQRYNFSKIRYSDHGPRRLLYVYLGMMPPAFMAAGHVGVSLVAFSPATPRACGSDDAHLRVDHARHAHDKVHVQVRHTVGAAPVECLVDVQVV